MSEYGPNNESCLGLTLKAIASIGGIAIVLSQTCSDPQEGRQFTGVVAIESMADDHFKGKILQIRSVDEDVEVAEGQQVTIHTSYKQGIKSITECEGLDWDSTATEGLAALKTQLESDTQSDAVLVTAGLRKHTQGKIFKDRFVCSTAEEILR